MLKKIMPLVPIICGISFVGVAISIEDDNRANRLFDTGLTLITGAGFAGDWSGKEDEKA